MPAPVPSHRAPSREPHGEPVLPPVSHDPGELEGASRDSAQNAGQTPALALPASEAHIASLLRRGERVLPVGAQSSLTGGAVPRGDTVLSLRRFNALRLEGDLVRAGAGVSLQALEEYLASHGRTYPAAPTYLGASVGGAVGTNASGAATFKYGTTRQWVEGLTVVLADGRVLELRRGEVLAHPDGYFEVQGAARRTRVPLPGYSMPEVPKLAAGYHARPGMDLVDLFVGAEGTLGVVTEVLLRSTPRRDTATVFAVLDNEEAALELVEALRGESRRTWATADPHGVDVRAIESLDRRCLQLLREDGHTRFVPAHAGYALIIQQELPPGTNAQRYAEIERAFEDDRPAGPLASLCRLLLTHDALDDAQIAMPGEPFAAEILKLREAVPEGVNRRVREAQRADGRITKVAGDLIVPFQHFRWLMSAYRQGFEARGLDYAIWGHVSDGNVHPNVLPRSFADVQAARELLFEVGREVVRLGGSPLSEHGVGKSPLKQALLLELYGEQGLRQMRAVKRSLDPHGQLAVGNLFPSG